MLANFLNKSKPINFITLLVLFFVSFVANLYSYFFKSGFTLDDLLSSIILLILFLVIFSIFNFIITKNELTLDNSYAYFFVTLFLMSILADIIDYKTLLLTLAYLLLIRKIYSLRSGKRVLAKLFDSGFWLGVLCIQKPLFIIFFLFIYIASYLHEKITVHTLLVPIIGFATPLFLYFTYFFWFDATEKFTSIFNIDLIFDVQFYKQTKYLWLTGSLFFFTALTIFFKSAKAFSINDIFKKSWILLISNFILLVFFLLFLPKKNGAELIFILFPIAIILANGIELIQKETLKNSLLYLALISSITLSFFL